MYDRIAFHIFKVNPQCESLFYELTYCQSNPVVDIAIIRDEDVCVHIDELVGTITEA